MWHAEPVHICVRVFSPRLGNELPEEIQVLDSGFRHQEFIHTWKRPPTSCPAGGLPRRPVQGESHTDQATFVRTKARTAEPLVVPAEQA